MTLQANFGFFPILCRSLLLYRIKWFKCVLVTLFACLSLLFFFNFSVSLLFILVRVSTLVCILIFVRIFIQVRYFSKYHYFLRYSNVIRIRQLKLSLPPTLIPNCFGIFTFESLQVECLEILEKILSTPFHSLGYQWCSSISLRGY